MADCFKLRILFGKSTFVFKKYAHITTFDPVFDILEGHKIDVFQPMFHSVFFSELHSFLKTNAL